MKQEEKKRQSGMKVFVYKCKSRKEEKRIKWDEVVKKLKKKFFFLGATYSANSPSSILLSLFLSNIFKNSLVAAPTAAGVDSF